MKRRGRWLVLTATVVLVTIGLFPRTSDQPVRPTLLSFRVGQSFDEVAAASSFSVRQRSMVPSPSLGMSGQTAIDEPAVILCFNDPQHGFVLPPTKFALIAYLHNVVDTATTSPMLDKLPFDQAVAILENLQNQFKAGGWEPWAKDGSKWFDFSQQGRWRLYQRMLERGHSVSAELRVPGKYGMTFRLKCMDGCWFDEKPPNLFLIDVSVGMDLVGRGPGAPSVWDKEHPANAAPTGPARFRCPDPGASSSATADTTGRAHHGSKGRT